MESMFEAMDYWAWWIAALVLFVIELAAPGIVFLWLAIAAAITGFAMLLIPSMSWQIAFVIFAVLSVITIIVGRRIWRPGNTPAADPSLNKRAEHHIGRTFTLDSALVNGRGRIHVGDSSWMAEGPDLPAGSSVRVTGVNGSILLVERAD
jgi:membrane protein implicated in regulation of membrane protease activity